MQDNTYHPEILSYYFDFEGFMHKVVYVPEMLPHLNGLDFTGNFLGIAIISENGTISFKREQHPDYFWECEKYPLDSAPRHFKESFTFREVRIAKEAFSIVIVPDLGCWEEDDNTLSFTGSFVGILSSAIHGTLPFQLEPGEVTDWEFICEVNQLPLAIVQWLADLATKLKDELVVDSQLHLYLS